MNNNFKIPNEFVLPENVKRELRRSIMSILVAVNIVNDNQVEKQTSELLDMIRELTFVNILAAASMQENKDPIDAINKVSKSEMQICLSKAVYDVLAIFFKENHKELNEAEVKNLLSYINNLEK